MSNITELSSEQLKRAANLKEQIENLEKELSSILGGLRNGTISSIATDDRRAKQSAAMKARWAARKKAKYSHAPAKRTMSPEARAKIAAAARKRWAAKKKVAAKD